MGLSNTLFEEFHWEGGRIANDGFADYKIATIADTPEIVPILVESEHPEAPFGAKGIGEPAAAATAPAIANALYDAVGSADPRSPDHARQDPGGHQGRPGPRPGGT